MAEDGGVTGSVTVAEATRADLAFHEQIDSCIEAAATGAQWTPPDGFLSRAKLALLGLEQVRRRAALAACSSLAGLHACLDTPNYFPFISGHRSVGCQLRVRAWGGTRTFFGRAACILGVKPSTVHRRQCPCCSQSDSFDLLHLLAWCPVFEPARVSAWGKAWLTLHLQNCTSAPNPSTVTPTPDLRADWTRLTLGAPVPTSLLALDINVDTHFARNKQPRSHSPAIPSGPSATSLYTTVLSVTAPLLATVFIGTFRAIRAATPPGLSPPDMPVFHRAYWLTAAVLAAAPPTDNAVHSTMSADTVGPTGNHTEDGMGASPEQSAGKTVTRGVPEVPWTQVHQPMPHWDSVLDVDDPMDDDTE